MNMNKDGIKEHYRIYDTKVSSGYLQRLTYTKFPTRCNYYVSVERWYSPVSKSFFIRMKAPGGEIVVDSGVIEDLYHILQKLKKKKGKR
jgi:hypothetical protein